MLLLLIPTFIYAGYLNIVLRDTFAGKRWQLPATVYAQPEELFVGKPVTNAQLRLILKRLSYRQRSINTARSYQYAPNRFVINQPAVQFWDQHQSAMTLRIRLAENRITELVNVQTGRSQEIVRLEPEIIGKFYPASNEDRQLTALNDVPQNLVQALLSTEDKKFYQHHGVNPLSILRALLANIRAGKAVQGGSTLTQQLVKNMFLTPDRNLWRKLNEAIMAVLLDAQFDKDEILEAYLNEIYLGQDGKRAVHGIAAASEYYFARQVKDLELQHAALLVGMIKGPSYYNPRRHPQRAKKRRDLVLQQMYKDGVISKQVMERATKKGLGVVSVRKQANSPYPAFLDLVKTQLRRDYSDSDIANEGLRIFTTLQTQKQYSVQAITSSRAAQLEKRYAVAKNNLQAAAIVVEPQTGEVMALTGSRFKADAGFNRALNAVRQIGSLIKPVTLLTALQQDDAISLATLIDDKPLVISQPDGDWRPVNFDKKFREQVTLYEAMTRSYNVPFVNLGMRVGVGEVLETVNSLGIRQKLSEYPSSLLGAMRLSPYDVAQLYQPFSAGGFYTPLQAIRSVIGPNNEPLKRYAVRVRQVMSAEQHLLVTTAMQGVMRSGTGKSARAVLPAEFGVAGKTGTTDELRDSWFAGFSGDELAVVWLGADNNTPIKMTGSSGALSIWSDIIKRTSRVPFLPADLPAVQWHWTNVQTGALSDSACASAVKLPYIRGSEPDTRQSCGESAVIERPRNESSVFDAIRDFFTSSEKSADKVDKATDNEIDWNDD